LCLTHNHRLPTVCSAKKEFSCMNFTVRCLCPGDLAAGDRLRAELGWNQTILDWQRLLALSPEGCFVAERNGRIVGTCTTVSYGSALAWIGAARGGVTRHKSGA
jgi:hypothetical protein